NVPKRGVGATSVERLRTYATEHDISFYEAAKEVAFTGITKRTANTVAEFQQMIENFNNQQEFLTATDLVEEVLEKTGYIEALKKDRTIESNSRIEKLEKFLTETKEFEKPPGEAKSLIAFLPDLARFADIDSMVNEVDQRVLKK